MSDLIVSDSLALALLPIILVMLVSLIAFLFRQVARSNETLARIDQQLRDISRDVERLKDSQ